MKYYIIAGEASGDLHGSNLMKALKQEDAQAQFRIWGGDRMEAAGGKLIKHYRDLAFMGFWEVLINLRTILGNIKFCKKDILAYQPDVLILIDYPGFNLRIANWAQEQNLRVFYYISPQIWAWHTSRVHQIKTSVDQMFVILPFEKDFYAKYNYPVNFVGHPLLDVVENYPDSPDFFEKNNLSQQPTIALLPGSRRQEISRMLSPMLKVVPDFPDHQFVIASVPSIEAEFYQEILDATQVPSQQVHLIHNQTYELLQKAEAALVASGTATLETALFGVPQIVCYRGSFVTYHIARRLVDLPHISLVNLIAEKEVVKELIQHDFNRKNTKTELQQLLAPAKRKAIADDYQLLRQKLGHAGASARAAQLMVHYLSDENTPASDALPKNP